MMVGDGDQKQEAVELIAKEGTGDQITLVPFRLDVPDIIAAADIYVLPSLWEGLPIALLEAMAMGKAVIGTKVDGTSEVIQDRENGLSQCPPTSSRHASRGTIGLSPRSRTGQLGTGRWPTGSFGMP
jgi:glycosyltransferase involved in cell wall biosynthesis